MKYITDYQLDIDRGFQYKIQDHINTCEFCYSKTTSLWYINGFTVLTRALDICWNDLLKKFTNCKIIDTIFFCNSKEQCYNLCQYIVATYFKPIDVSKEPKKWYEKSRRHLLKYYTILEQKVHFPERTFQLRQLSNGTWYWHNLNVQVPSRCIFSQFSLSSTKVLDICNNLGILASLSNNTVVFETTLDAIKFTDYLLETYIIKKEKTYDTNQLRKERTAISRGAKPAGGIIHGRRSKASVRCGCIEHKARFGS